MAVSGVFVGASLTVMDDKGRIAVPASLRNAVPLPDDAAPDTKTRDLYVARHPESPCLVGSGVDRLQQIAADIAHDEEQALRRDLPFKRSAEQRRRYGGGGTVTCDASGRFVLPPMLRMHSELVAQEDIFLFGVGDFFEIWSVAQLMALDDPDYADVQAMARVALQLAAQGK
jgi:MraZ protein